MGRRDKMARQDAQAAGQVRTQYAALCWRAGPSGTEVLLVTSRDTGRWIIPKGWPMLGMAPEAAAAQEAWEEAGVEGLVNPVALGRYGYQKVLALAVPVPCAVVVYGLQVTRQAETYPEAHERRRAWFPLAEAAPLVQEPDLGRLIAGFVPPEPMGRRAPTIGD
jgi:8-oxo-dGTP pyrophosphatase MutT (NUDIX family)